MGEVVDIRCYLNSSSGDALETALMHAFDAMLIRLSDSDKREVYAYAKKLWAEVKKMEADSLQEYKCASAERQEQNEHLHCLINPRTKMINNLVAELIVCKIKEIQAR